MAESKFKNNVVLAKKLEEYTDGNGNRVQSHALYIIKPNGWKIKIKAVFKGRDFYDLLEVAKDLDEKPE